MVDKAKHPAISKFPDYADQISSLMDGDESFYGLCQDYQEISCEIANTESRGSHIDGVLKALLELRSDLEDDMLNYLREMNSTNSESSL